ncbi:MAG0490 family ComEA-like DNA-binding protein [Mycoplasma simbae]|uniref:MAG0490 family ComEA-like DNA-binding protein n=1 Tax=Mycoplasma simbae TaxID=36744 RepID=UPI000495CD42|nr:helix-hairpin-helix domain-containing protein [Mycoplasma simbae]
MRKRVWILGSVLAAGIFGLALSLSLDQKQTFISKTNQNKEVKVKISGAVLHPGEYEVPINSTLKQALIMAKPRADSDLTSIDQNQKIASNITIKIPFKKVNREHKPAISWSQINSLVDLTNLGISKSIAQKLLTHRKNNPSTTWEKINQISGIGSKALEKLKKVLIL